MEQFKTKDGTTIGDFIHVLDLAQIHIISWKLYKKTFKVFNCGYGQGSSVREIVINLYSSKEKRLNLLLGIKGLKILLYLSLA